MTERNTSAAPASAAGATGGTDRLGLVLLASITLFWGVNWPAMKIAVAEMPPWTFRTLCLVVGGLGLLAVGRAARLPLRVPPRQLGPLMLVSLFNVTGWHLFSAFGVLYMAAGRASIIAFTMPLWAALLSVPILGDRLAWSTVTGLAVGMAGMAVLVIPDWQAVLAQPLGLAFMLLAALSWAAGTVYLKRWQWEMPTSVLAGWQILIGGVPVTIGALLFERGFDPSAMSWQGWAAAIYAALIPMIYCQWAWFRVVEIYPAAVAAIGTLAIPVLGILSSNLVLHEPIGIDVLLSLVLVTAGLGLVLFFPQLRTRRTGRPAVAEQDR